MNNLTKIAALPGSGAGCMAYLPAEKMDVISRPTIPASARARIRSDELLAAGFVHHINSDSFAAGDIKIPGMWLLLDEQEYLRALDGLIDAAKAEPAVQMKAPYFQEHDDLVFPPIDLGMVGGDGA